jgi:hypothetical protein
MVFVLLLLCFLFCFLWLDFIIRTRVDNSMHCSRRQSLGSPYEQLVKRLIHQLLKLVKRLIQH